MTGNNAGEWEWMPTRQIRDERQKKRLRNMKRWRKVEKKKMAEKITNQNESADVVEQWPSLIHF